MPDRLTDTIRFYQLLDRLTQRIGGPRLLQDCNGRMNWPQRGVYFFFEPGENRSSSNSGPRVVRVGTHALKNGSSTKLWSRLNGHRGSASSGGGNHRGSIFRLLVGVAIAKRDNMRLPKSWGIAADPGKAAQRLGMARTTILDQEVQLESSVSDYIRAMPFLYLNVDDPSQPQLPTRLHRAQLHRPTQQLQPQRSR